MTIEDDIAFLERIPILRRLGPPALRILAIGAEGYRLEPGQVLFTAGDAADCAYAIQDGSFALKPEHGEAEIIRRGRRPTLPGGAPMRAMNLPSCAGTWYSAVWNATDVPAAEPLFTSAVTRTSLPGNARPTERSASSVGASAP